MDKREHIILGMIWQLMKMQQMNQITLTNHPYLIRLKQEDEEMHDLLALSPDQLLMRWFNYHLQNAGVKNRVTNFSDDVKDGENYVHLLNQLDDSCNKAGLDMQGENRAQKILEDAQRLGVPKFLKPHDICSGNPKLNLLFCSQLFNTCPGLHATEEEKYACAELIDDDVEGSREERSFRMWLNSLMAKDDVYINNLHEDIKDGVVLLKVIDKVQPGIV